MIVVAMTWLFTMYTIMTLCTEKKINWVKQLSGEEIIQTKRLYPIIMAKH